jgi:hypothetical protein
VSSWAWVKSDSSEGTAAGCCRRRRYCCCCCCWRWSTPSHSQSDEPVATAMTGFAAAAAEVSSAATIVIANVLIGGAAPQAPA